MRIKKISALSIFVLLTTFLNASGAYACMLASGCEDGEFTLYTRLNEGKEDNQEAELPPTAEIRVRNDTGNSDQYSGTLNTTFTFDGNGSYDYETPSYYLEVRFDFENDGKIDTFYSRRKTASHKYKTTGEKTIRMEVLDRQGNITTAYTKVNVVHNTPPNAYFTISPLNGTPETIFTLYTKESYDNQYNKSLLEYRFDWEKDGKYDTKFQNKNMWQHKFLTPGEKNVTLQVRDPEGLTSTYSVKIVINSNTPPTTSFTIDKESGSDKYANYKLDASDSKDPDGGKLNYRWDFNFTGENDIVWDSTWASSPRNFANFYKAGEYVIRLMVRDEDGATNVSLVKIVVELINNLSK